MQRKGSTILLCAAACLSITLAGCQRDDTTVVKAAAPPPSTMPAAGKTSNSGAVFSQKAVPAPSGVDGGNYAGGKKD